MNAPPQQIFSSDVPLTHKIFEFYKKIYLISSRISKRDRFGIWLKIENVCLEIIALSITASFKSKNNKIEVLYSARIETEKLKRLIRLASELNIINNGIYLTLESDLQEISKMVNGWIKYLNN